MEEEAEIREGRRSQLKIQKMPSKKWEREVMIRSVKVQGPKDISREWHP